MSQSKVNSNLPRPQRQWSAGNPTQMQGEGYKGNRYNPNRGRGGYRQGGRGGPRGGYNKNQNQQNQHHNNQQQQRGGSQKHQYGNNKQMPNKQYMVQGQQPGQIPNQQMSNQAPPDQQAQQMQAQQPQQPQQPQQQFQQSQYPPMQLPEVNVAELDTLQGDERRTFVGNNIYQTIEARFGEELAPIITGTLLDENVVDFKQLFTNAQYFTSRVQEAHQLLLQSKQGQQPQPPQQQK